MKQAFLSILILGFSTFASVARERPRIIVLTDLSNEPDDEESLVRFLVYANEFDVEGLIASTSTHLKKGPREDILHHSIDAYGKVLPNLSKHAPGYPTAAELHAVCRTGQTGFGMADVGQDRSTAGSKRMIEVVDKADARPVWITVWGGANTLAQALWDVRATRDAAAVDAFIGKLRVYTISDQDDAGYWIRPEFPKLFYIASPSTVGGKDYWRATWTGISGDARYQNGIRHRFDMVDNPWLLKNIRTDHGPLGELYPYAKYIMEGDTPSFLGLINNGLGWDVRPDYGGWGGRYKEFQPDQPVSEKRKLWTESPDSRDTVTSDDNGKTETSVQATIWRWREHFQNDFAARMDWCVADDFQKANHNPTAVLNGDRTKKVLTLSAKGGSTVSLTAKGTGDPDGNPVSTKWWIYPEAGTIHGATLTTEEGLKTEVRLPQVEMPGTLHVILQVEDGGEPHLFAYRRALIEVTPVPSLETHPNPSPPPNP